jgi:predicted transcriptional regulator
MTKDELDEVHEMKGKICKAVHELVDRMTENLPDRIDDLVRQQLVEEFRFWRYP